MESDGGKNLNQRKEPDKSEIPDLTQTMQAMSIAEPGLCRIQGSQVMKQEELDFSCCLLMKVACTGGSPRFLTQQALKQSMEKAWKEKFHGISQVSNSVFMAHFKTKEDMISVYIKQPWVANSENLLLDWFDPNFNATSSDDYRFDTILVTVRAYGIPRNKRSIGLLKNILNQVGEISDFHILQENNLFAKQDYIYGTAKMMVDKPVKDRAVVSFEDDSSTVAYLHYEKIKRACLFCGILFHNAQDCNIRNNLVSERQKKRQSSADIPSQRFGQWIINDSHIPAEVIRNTRMGEHVPNQEGSEILNRLKNLFAQDPKGKGKVMEALHANQTQGKPQGNLFLGTVEQNYPNLSKRTSLMEYMSIQNEKEGRLNLPGAAIQIDGQNVTNKGRTESSKEKKEVTEAKRNSNHKVSETNVGSKYPELQVMNAADGNVPMVQHTEVQPENNQQKHLTGSNATPAISPRTSNPKRSAPFTEVTKQPFAKRPSILQCASRATPPYNPSLSLAQNAELMNNALGIQNPAIGASILGAAPGFSEHFNTYNANVFVPRIKNKPSRWDVQTRNQFKPGTNTWKRNVAATARRNQSPKNSNAISSSPCRSDTNSAIAGSYEHDPWPLHTANASYTQGTPDSRHGAFSPPQMTREMYEPPSMYAGAFQGTGQGNLEIQQATRHDFTSQDMTSQDQEARNKSSQSTEAEAPAFKAPRAP
jgi:hypothetical protein